MADWTERVLEAGRLLGRAGEVMGRAVPAIGQTAIRSFGGLTRAEADQMFRRGFNEGYADGYNDGGEDEPVSGTTRRYGYRRTTQGLRDFTQIDRERIIEIVWTLVQSNPVADRAMEIKRDYILGRGVQFQTRDDDLQDIFDDFWHANKMSQRLKEFTFQLFLFGVQCYPVFVRKSDGRVRLGYIDPAEIEDVIAHPENAMEMWAVVVKSQTATQQWERTIDRQVYRIVRTEEAMSSHYANWLKAWEQGERMPVDEDEEGEPVRPLEAGPGQDRSGDGSEQGGKEVHEGKMVTAGQAKLEPWEEEMLRAMGLEEYSGSVFYVKVNSASNQPHGYSDLLQVADWLDQQDEVLFALADREQWANFFSWDVTLKGVKDVKKRATEIRSNPPRRGSLNVHNDAEEWRLDYPSLQQSGSIETARAIQNHSFGGLGFPEAWFGRGDDTNRATLEAQGDPTWRTLEHDQDSVRDMILDMLHFVRDQAEIAGHWTPDAEDELREQLAAEDTGLVSRLFGRNGRKQDEEDSEGQDLELDTAEDVDPREVTVIMPEMTARDLGVVSSMLSTIAGALVVAEEQAWQDKAKSVEIWAKALGEFGIEMDVAAIQQAIEEKEEEEKRLGAGPGQNGSSPFRTGGMNGSAVGRHGVMLADDDEEPKEWADMSRAEQALFLEAFLGAVGVDRTLEDVEGVLEAVELLTKENHRRGVRPD